jgi:hypothetical protein
MWIFTFPLESFLKVPQVFAVQDWAAFGYLVFAPPDSHAEAALKLKIQQHPPTSRLVTLLGATPPKGEVEARKWFSVLATRISGLSALFRTGGDLDNPQIFPRRNLLDYLKFLWCQRGQ